MAMVLVALVDDEADEHYLAVLNQDTKQSILIARFDSEEATTRAARDVVLLNGDEWDEIEGIAANEATRRLARETDQSYGIGGGRDNLDA